MMDLFPLLVVIVVCVVLLAFLVGRAGSARFRYRAGKAVLSPAELAFYGRLRRVVEPRALVLAKVRIADVLSVDGKSAGRRAIVALNLIAAKHTDFCVIDVKTAIPICCIELDDASHESRAARKRDALVNDAFASAGLRLLRIPLKAIPDDPTLSAKVLDVEPESDQKGPNPDESGEGPDALQVIRPMKAVTDPVCRCGRGMVRRQGRHGSFWGCPTYPKCDHTLPMR